MRGTIECRWVTPSKNFIGVTIEEYLYSLDCKSLEYT